MDTLVHAASATTAEKPELPWVRIPALPVSHCGTSSQVPSLPSSLQWMQMKHLAWSLGPRVSNYYCLPKRARDGFPWDQIIHMCFCCAPLYLNGICQKLSEGTTISLNWKNLGHTVETLATSSKRMGDGRRLAATSHLPPWWSPRQQWASTSSPGPSPLPEASPRLPSLPTPPTPAATEEGAAHRQGLDPLPQSLYT